MTRQVAKVPCTECGTKVALTLTKKGRLTFNCTAAGCGYQFFSRSEATDRRIAARAMEWEDTTLRAQLGANPKPEAPKPAALPKPAEKPAQSWLDRPLF